MKIGGYQIIDLKGKNLTTNVGMVYDGLYELIEGTRKPILLSGIQIDDKEYQDCYVIAETNGTNYEFRAYDKKFTVSDLNVITVVDDKLFQVLDLRGLYTNGEAKNIEFENALEYCSVDAPILLRTSTSICFLNRIIGATGLVTMTGYITGNVMYKFIIKPEAPNIIEASTIKFTISDE